MAVRYNRMGHDRPAHPGDLRRVMLRGTLWMVVWSGLAGSGCGPVGRVADNSPLEPVAVLGGVGTNPGQLFYPRAIDSDGSSLWVIDKTARVQRLDPETGNSLGEWRMPESRLGMPTGVTSFRDSSGDVFLFVPDTHYHRVMVYRVGSVGTEASLVGEFGRYGTGDGEFIYPTDVAILPTSDGGGISRIYVSEYGGNDRISVFDASHRFLYAIGKFGTGERADATEFNRPQSIGIDVARGWLVVTDSSNHRVGKLTLDGKVIEWFGSRDRAGREPGQFRYPYGLELLGDGTVVVTEFGNNRVQRIDLETGRVLRMEGKAGRGPGELFSPWASVAVGRRLYVLDSGNNRIQVLDWRLPRGGRGG